MRNRIGPTSPSAANPRQGGSQPSGVQHRGLRLGDPRSSTRSLTTGSLPCCGECTNCCPPLDASMLASSTGSWRCRSARAEAGMRRAGESSQGDGVGSRRCLHRPLLLLRLQIPTSWVSACWLQSYIRFRDSRGVRMDAPRSEARGTRRTGALARSRLLQMIAAGVRIRRTTHAELFCPCPHEGLTLAGRRNEHFIADIVFRSNYCNSHRFF